MALVPSNCASDIYDQYSLIIQPPFDVSGYPDAFATAYDDYASLGVVSGAISGGGDKSIISNAWSGPLTVTTLGTALANYWATVALTPAPPNISSVNNATSLTSSFIAAITSSLRDTESTPYFLEFVSNVETVVKSIQWTITPPPPGTPFVSMIT